MKNQQLTFSDIEYSYKKRTTKKEIFLDTMNNIITWDEWIDIIVPFYPSGKRGQAISSNKERIDFGTVIGV